jgi:hypothetical protein
LRKAFPDLVPVKGVVDELMLADFLVFLRRSFLVMFAFVTLL